MKLVTALLLSGSALQAFPQESNERPRARDLGIVIGDLPTGQWNAITDVRGVLVGHATIVRGANVRTGVTIIRPHPGDAFQQKVPAAVVVGNGFGKLAGSTQIEELGELETPIALTNTLCVGRVLDVMIPLLIAGEQNRRVRSINVVVGETNDGYLNDIRGQHVTAKDVQRALAEVNRGKVAEGCVGAGTGTVCFGWKGGIGTSSRVVKLSKDLEYTVGVLVQSNFGGSLRIDGVPAKGKLRRPALQPKRKEDGSCMIVVATDAPLSVRNLKRLGRRALVGMGRTGASFSNGSGDYVIAFTNAKDLRIRPGAAMTGAKVLGNGRMSKLFVAVADATEEAILNSMLRATTMTGQGRTVHALPIEQVKKLIAK